MSSRCSRSSISSRNHRSVTFSYFVWNLENSEILAQKLCISDTDSNRSFACKNYCLWVLFFWVLSLLLGITDKHCIHPKTLKWINIVFRCITNREHFPGLKSKSIKRHLEKSGVGFLDIMVRRHNCEIKAIV